MTDTGKRALSLAPAGRWLAGSSVLFMVVGLAANLPIVTTLGGAGLVGLVWAAGLARVVAHRIARGELRVGLTLPGDRAHGGPIRLTVGSTCEIPLAVSQGPRVHIRALSLAAGATPPIGGNTLERDGEWLLELQALRMGHGVIHGFHVNALVAGGLVSLSTWLAVRQAVTILPKRFPLRRDPPLMATRAALQDRGGMGRSRRRGFGLELRELRDHQPGDPFKHIAWAATARRGKLVTREFESDLMLSGWILVDTSPSMFWGEAGGARIDFAMETAYNLATLLLARGDRVGLMLHDDRVRLTLPPTARRGQSLRILDALLEAPHLLHEDRTEITDRELVEAVGSWFEAQERRSFRLPAGFTSGPRAAAWDLGRLHDAARELLAEAQAQRQPGRFPVPIADYARDRRQATLRAFCRHHGIPVRLDPTPRPGGQARGLEASVERVLRTSGGPHTLIIISDLHTADELDALRRAALGARRHHHQMVVLCPADPAFAGRGPLDGPLGDALSEVEQLRTRQSLATVEAILRPAGVRILACSPDDVTPRLLHRLDQVA